VLRRKRSAPGTGSLLGPPALELERDRVRVGEGWLASFAVVSYPSEVARGWLAPLLRAARDADVALHVEPIAPVIASERLRRQRARLESTRRLERERSLLPDPFVAAAAEDAEELAARLARGESRLFRSGRRSRRSTCPCGRCSAPASSSSRTAASACCCAPRARASRCEARRSRRRWSRPSAAS